MARLTLQDKVHLVNTYDACQSISETAVQCRVCRATARRCINRWRNEQSLENKPGTGRKAILSEAAALHASNLLDEGQQGGAQQVAKQLLAEGLVPRLVHKSTVIRAARKAAESEGCKMVVSKPRPPKELTKDTKKKRLQFAKENSKTSWGHVLFTDRKKFYFRYPGSSVQPCRWQKVGPNRPKNMGPTSQTSPSASMCMVESPRMVLLPCIKLLAAARASPPLRIRRVSQPGTYVQHSTIVC